MAEDISFAVVFVSTYLFLAETLTSESTETPGVDPASAEKKPRKSRWSTTKSFVPGMPTILPSNLKDEQRQAYLRKIYYLYFLFFFFFFLFLKVGFFIILIFYSCVFALF